jgi:uncharacterized protein
MNAHVQIEPRLIMLVPGKAVGKPLLLQEPVSFWGGVDSRTGRIIDRWHKDHDALLSGRVLMMERGRGSSSGSSVLGEAIRAGTAPSAILLRTRDAIVTIGALVARELYGKDCPVICVTSEADWLIYASAAKLTILADDAGVSIL